ncbi:HNH endonuclease [Phormidium sp. LEGE 05292]|uniref:HNH endonuclease n=1 Tax=[Phormidium] sp. LEGE 05292 TaxID=767427 RepID=UPI00187EB023|nr:HNH endonuclease [Phormidium sp. LEGE 05292]MBE9225685.1 HNH endonuclease [Phormidium sp. LEGE 05292]
MSTYISESLRNLIAESDRQRCCYCLTSEANSGIPMSYDHIQPVSKGGETSFKNVCLACRSCNEFKSDATEAVDPVTGETVPLFNPRTQNWYEHFAWSYDSTKIEGLTNIGRATIVRLRMNNSVIVAARRRWAISGWHPPAN